MQQLTPVTSSRFAAIGFDDDTFQMFVQYHATEKEPHGAVYRYDNVSPELFDDFSKAPSLGGFFNATFHRNPEYPAVKIKRDGDEEAQSPAAEEAVADAPAESFRNPDEAVATALVVAQKAKALVIANPGAYEQAARELLTIAGEIKRRREFFAPMKDAAFKTHREICARETEALQPLQEAERALTSGITSYRQTEERRRREEQERIDAAARKVAQEEADRRARELAEERARAHEVRGEADRAAAVRANPAPVAPAYVAPAVVHNDTPQVQGLSFAADFDFEIEDETQIPLSHEFYTLDLKKVRAKVKQMKQHCKIPGVRVFPVERARKRASA